jgi:hypothetical protein
MPVIQINALPQKPGVDPQAVMKSLCRSLAAVMGLKEKQIWATWETIQPGMFVEGSVAALVQPEATHPPVVNLIAFEGRPKELINRMLECVAQTLSEGLGIERGNVFLTYTEATSGRLYTGGEIRFTSSDR